MAGIYNADADRQSILATFPRFRDLEKSRGSLIRGMSAARRQSTSSQTAPRKLSAFMSFRGGTAELIDALIGKLGGQLCSSAEAENIEASDESAYRVRLSDGTVLECDRIVLATPAFTSAALLQSVAPAAAAELDKIRYQSTGTVSLGFRHDAVTKALDGFGLLIPRSEKRPINAITLSSTKFDERAPDGSVLIRVFFGGGRSPQSMALNDLQLLQMVREELRSLVGIEAKPLFHRIYHWWDANPQYDVGHLERVKRIESLLPPGVYVSGSAYRGVGLPDCIHQSQILAAAIIQSFLEYV
jgi:oxygen-dependent protoporphyrinogen oxidase